MSHPHTPAEHYAMASALLEDLQHTLETSRHAACTPVVFSAISSLLLNFYVLMRQRGHDFTDDLLRLTELAMEMAETDTEKLEALSTFYSDQVNESTRQ